MMTIKIKLKIFSVLILFAMLIVPSNGITAAMQSESYIIYENAMHTFDGPVISGVSESVAGNIATVTWNTNIAADSFVIYDTDSGFASAKEQGTSVKSATAHSVDVTGLEYSTTYYYRVRSERINGGITTDNTARSFTTGSAPAEPEPDEPVSGGGGGILIIDKTDKIPPVISSVDVDTVSEDSARITWRTDEEATSFVEYGPDTTYGNTYGHWEEVAEHAVILINLTPGQRYNFRALSSDTWGNAGYSENFIFTTTEGLVEEATSTPEEAEEPEPEPETEDASARILEFFGRLFPEISLNELGQDPLTTIDSFDKLSGLLPIPVMSGSPDIDVSATQTTIGWQTDITANSLVAFAPEDRYNPGAAEPYLQITGDSEEQTREHEVTLYNLAPDTLYHFQLRSKANFGPTARSRDYTFRTSIEELEITSYFTQIVDNETAVFKWTTNKESDSAIKFSPYRGNVLSIDQSKTIKDTAVSVIHEIEINEFEAGTFYEVQIISIDANGNMASETVDRFSTSEDDLPPIVSHIKADSTVFVDRSNKTQAIISWLTNEPSTSRVYFQEGVHGGDATLSETTDLNNNYTKEHVVVITKFKPGLVYSFKVESIDSGGNTVISKPHTFMTAKKKESIIQIILNILENTFGWINKII
ncbi:MAG: fibronectin type III domain-containing protein [Candidatus Falkowbacteria bacterium]